MYSQNILGLIYLFSIHIVLCESRPKWNLGLGSCSSGDDCPLNHCCAIGFTRYSSPQCLPLGQMGNWCRVYNEPQNKTLAYPNGQYFEFSNIYTQFCPCSAGLVCERAKCMPDPLHFDQNFLNIDY